MKWKAFNHNGLCYDLSHTHPFDHTFCVEIDGVRREFKCHVQIGHHVFTKAQDANTASSLVYIINDVQREQREFDFERYELSKQLPTLVRLFGDKKCKLTGKGNFLRFEVVMANGVSVNYEIYFRVTKPSQKGWITLSIESAYVSDDIERAKLKQRAWRNMRFALIARNTLECRKINN